MIYKEALYRFIIYILTISCVGPFAFVIAGPTGIPIMLLFTYVIISQKTYKPSIALALIAISFNFSLLIVVWTLHNMKVLIWDEIRVEFSIILVTIFAITSLGQEILTKYQKNLATAKLLKISVIFLIASIITSYAKFSLKLNILVDSPYLLGIFYGITLGILTGIIAKHLILPTIGLFKYIGQYIKVIALPMAAFFCGYIVIFLTFAGIYALLAKYDTTAFAGNYSWSLNQFIAYSISNITTLGDTQMYANTILTQWLSSLEVFLGVVWTTVVLAATIGYAQKDFDKL
jgi:hypothetical protein